MHLVCRPCIGDPGGAAVRANWAAFGTTVLVFIRVRDELEIKDKTEDKERKGFCPRSCLPGPPDR